MHKFPAITIAEKKMRVRPNSHLIGCRLRVMLMFGESHPGFFPGDIALTQDARSKSAMPPERQGFPSRR
jgi:hypothetical protein